MAVAVGSAAATWAAWAWAGMGMGHMGGMGMGHMGGYGYGGGYRGLGYGGFYPGFYGGYGLYGLGYGGYGLGYGGYGLGYGGYGGYGMGYGGYGGYGMGYGGYGMGYGGYGMGGYGYPYYGGYGMGYSYPYTNTVYTNPVAGFGYSSAYVAPAAGTMMAGQGRYLGIDEEPAVDAGGRKGMKVTNVYPGTAAEMAGLQAGDVIHSINGYLTEQRGNLAWIIANAAKNNILKMNVLTAKDGKEHTVTAQLP